MGATASSRPSSLDKELLKRLMLNLKGAEGNHGAHKKTPPPPTNTPAPPSPSTTEADDDDEPDCWGPACFENWKKRDLEALREILEKRKPKKTPPPPTTTPAPPSPSTTEADDDDEPDCWGPACFENWKKRD